MFGKGLKAVALCAVLMLLSMGVFSSGLDMFPLSHPVYSEMEALYIIEGKASPLGFKPWTAVDVAHMLDSVEAGDSSAKALKDRISGYIYGNDKDFAPYFGIAFNPVLNIHSNSSEFNTSSYYYDKDLLNTHILDLELGMTYKDNIAGYMDFSLGFIYSDAEFYMNESGSEAGYSSTFSTNIPFLTKRSISMNFPDRAYVALGWDAFRAVVARDRVSWGNGMMGNMLLGDTLPYHDYLSLTFTGSRNFSYQMLMSFFTHPVNLLDVNGPFTPGAPETDYDRLPLSGVRFLLGHRFEMRFFSGKVMLALNEAVMYQSEEGYVDPRVFNPLMFLHDLYIGGNANSLATLELEYSPVKNLLLYFQFGVDDLAIPGENSPGSKGASSDGWGLQAGLKLTMPRNGGNYYYGTAEFIYTSPFMYHRAQGSDPDQNDLSLSYISTTRVVGGSRPYTIARYLSFPFGSDAIAAALRFGYRDIDSFDVNANLFFMAHGVIRKYSKIDYYREDGGLVTNTPSTQNPFDPNAEENMVEYTFGVGVDASIDLTSYLSVESGLYLITVWNKGNVARSAVCDMQFSIGLTLKY